MPRLFSAEPDLLIASLLPTASFFCRSSKVTSIAPHVCESIVYFCEILSAKNVVRLRSPSLYWSRGIIRPGFEARQEKRIIGESRVAESAYIRSGCQVARGCWIEGWRSNRLSWTQPRGNGSIVVHRRKRAHKASHALGIHCRSP